MRWGEALIFEVTAATLAHRVRLGFWRMIRRAAEAPRGPVVSTRGKQRGRLARAMDAEVRTLKLLRKLDRSEAQAPGPLVQSFLVEVRVLSNSRAPRS